MFFLIVLFIFIYRSLNISRTWAFGDLEAFPLNTGITRNWAFYIWNEEGLGRLSSGTFNYYLTIALLSSVLGGSLAQKIIVLSAPLLSFLTFFYLLRKTNVNLNASVLGALAYSFNPVTISEFIGGSLVFLAIYLFFPVIFCFFVELIQRQKVLTRDAVVLGLLCFSIFSIHIGVWYTLVLIPLLLSTLPRSDLRRISRLAVPLTIGLLILFPNILGSFGIYGSISTHVGSFQSDAFYTYRDSNFYNVVRLAGNNGNAQAEEFLNYNTLNTYTILAYAMPLVAFLYFIIQDRRAERNKRILALSMALAFVVLSGLILLVKAMPSLVDLHPILGSLRNPAKLMYPLSFTLCFLFALGAEQVVAIKSRKHDLHWKTLAILALIVFILFSNYPALDGTMGLARFRDNHYYVDDKYCALPQMLEKIDADYFRYRVLILPWEYSTLLKIRSQMPNYFGMSVGAGIYGNTDWLESAFEMAVARNSSERSFILGILGVKYVVIDKSFRSSNEGQEWYENLRKSKSYFIYESQNSYWAGGESSYYHQVFDSDPNFELINEQSDFAVFENGRTVSELYVRSNAETFSLSYVPISGNLLKNPSFENSAEYWEMWPSKFANITYDYDDADNIMALGGQEEWFTASYQDVPVKENTLYSLEFSVKGYNITDMHTKVLWYTFTDNLTEGNAAYVQYIDLAKMNLTNGNWSNIKDTFPALREVKMARILFLGNRLENFSNTVMYIDDVSFYEIELAVVNRNEIFSSVNDISYHRINPTRLLTKINATSPFVIAFSETYNPSWICYVNSERVSSFPLYGFINGFWINQTGLLEVTIEFEPQRWFFYGSIISVTTFLACLTYLTYDYLRSRVMWKQIKATLGRRTPIRSRG